jgi:endoglucanase
MKQLLLLFAFLFTQLIAQGQIVSPPLKKGFNLPEWFENFDQITNIKFKEYIRQDFENIKALGCDHVRLPIEFFDATGPSHDFTVDTLLFYFIDQAANWAEELELYLIIDNHSFGNTYDTEPGVEDTLLAVWPQIAEHFKNRSKYIIYEVLNEPHGIYDLDWDGIQQRTINAIREIDNEHFIIVGPANWNNHRNLRYLSEYNDDKLIYTFHFYDPYLLTTDVGVNIPYPYNPASMPSMPPEWSGDWYEELYNEYPTVGNNSYLYQLIDTAINFGEEREVPIYCGEFGVNILNCDTTDRAYWIKTVRTYLEGHNIPWAMWSYKDYMGIFDPQTPELFEYDIDTVIAKALGLNYPAQKEFQVLPDADGFFLFDDYIPQFIITENWYTGGQAQYLSQNAPKLGNFCISWSNADQYGNLGFRFYPVRDLSQLAADGCLIDFWIRCNTPGIQIEMRFEDTDTGAMDHAWRRAVTIDETMVNFDGTWQHIRIPLAEFIETYAWEDNTLYPAEGKFDWTRINRFDFVAEYSNLHNVELFFDNIQIVDSSAITPNEMVEVQKTKPQFYLYNNPYNNSTQITFELSETLPIKIALYDLAGKEIKTITQQTFTPGLHIINWERESLVAGMYVMQLQSNKFISTKKLIISH